jgi:hypothetical protein
MSNHRTQILSSLISEPDFLLEAGFLVSYIHRIVKDKIGDVSVKLQFNQEEAWTRSLRHVLLALKICLKWATNGTNG